MKVPTRESYIFPLGLNSTQIISLTRGTIVSLPGRLLLRRGNFFSDSIEMISETADVR